MVYDLTRKETLEKLPLWIEQLKKYSPDVRLFLVGNKNDLVDDRQVTFNEGEQTKDRLQIVNFFETSAKTGNYIQETFEDLAKLLVETNLNKIIDIKVDEEK